MWMLRGSLRESILWFLSNLQSFLNTVRYWQLWWTNFIIIIIIIVDIYYAPVSAQRRSWRRPLLLPCHYQEIIRTISLFTRLFAANGQLQACEISDFNLISDFCCCWKLQLFQLIYCFSALFQLFLGVFRFFYLCSLTGLQLLAQTYERFVCDISLNKYPIRSGRRSKQGKVIYSGSQHIVCSGAQTHNLPFMSPALFR